MDPEALRAVMRGFPQGVVVVTAAPPDGESRGITVSSFMSVCLDPPLVVICIMRQALAHGGIESAGSFTINILAEDQGPVSDHFATPNLSSEEQFSTIEHQSRSGKAPLITGSIGFLDCKVVARMAQGTHTLFVGEVQGGKLLSEDRPLVFYSRRYWGVGEETHRRD
ncbi:MAG: flavin reductase family protein [Vicinamibacteria bacterium]